jgi:hypothetical protein
MNIFQRKLDERIIYEIFDEADRLRGTCFSEQDAIIMRIRLELAEHKFTALIEALEATEKEQQQTWQSSGPAQQSLGSVEPSVASLLAQVMRARTQKRIDARRTNSQLSPHPQNET